MTDAIKIYGIPQSRVARCVWMVRELGVPHEVVPVHYRVARETPELLRVNPNGRIPAMDDNGFALFESTAINLYLAKKYGSGSALVPRSLEEEALVTQWSFWVVAELEKPLVMLLVNAIGYRVVDEEALAKARSDLDRPLRVLDGDLSTRPWMLGDRFTVADLNVASVLDWQRTTKLDLSPYPHVADWLSRCLGRPAFKGLSLG
ncbi:glutathione S-transferase family protein [Dankookia sp. GCM10030260]|uniref:glutathione S-transferase family protein n=1 Tax=Dankookia sp. GCM10030260 TaxID=3273390 RepID=UPI0036194A86